MKRRTKLLVAAALALGLLAAWPVAAHYRLKAELRAYQRQLVARGEKLTLAELTPPFSSETVWNAKSLLMLANRLRSVVPGFTNQPPLMAPAIPGHAVVSWQQDPLPTADVADLWPGLSNDLAAAQATLDQTHTLLQSPRLDFALDYSQGYTLLLPHLAPFKGLAQWLSADAVFALHEHRPAEACASLQALLGLVQHHQEEPLMISVLVRLAVGSIAASTSWELLQAPDLQEPQLQQLQQAWSEVDVLPQTEASLSMERVISSDLFARGRVSFGAISAVVQRGGSVGSGMTELLQLGKDVLDNPAEGLGKMARRYPGYWRWKCFQSYDDELAGDQLSQAGLETLRSARAQGAWTPALHAFEQATNVILQAHPKAGLWLEFSPGDNLRGFLSRVHNFELQRAVVIAAIALQRYHLRHGAYPAQLNALCPECLAQVPRDPADGQPLRYRLDPDGSFRLYSIGDDGVDNGGDPTPATTNGSSPKRWTQGRDVVWPTRASAQETRAYYDTLAAKREGHGHKVNPSLQARYGLAAPPTPSTNSSGK